MNSEIMKLLGQQNIEKLKQDICKIIANKFIQDIDDESEFWVTGSDFVDLIDEIKVEIKTEIKQKILNKLLNEIDKLNIAELMGEKGE